MPKDGAQNGAAIGLVTKLILVFGVVIFGSLNNIVKQIAAKPLRNYTYMLSLVTAVFTLLFYAIAVSVVRSRGQVEQYQFDFIWKTKFLWKLPVLLMFASAALGDTLGDGIGMICTPYVAGPVHSLTANMTPIFIALLTLIFTPKRYSLLQCWGMVGVLAAVAIGMYPSFRDGIHGATDPFFATILAGSCIFNAYSWVLKEALFARYTAWKLESGIDDHRGLDVFVVSGHAAMFALPFTLASIPLNQLLGQMHGQDLSTYIQGGIACILGNCGPDVEPDESEGAPKVVGVYVLFNLLWNIFIMMSVKASGALPTFIALKAIFPVSTVLFAYVDWPFLGRTHMDPLVWLGVAIMLPSIGVYQYASDQQKARQQKEGVNDKCCWPLGTSKLPPEVERPLTEGLTPTCRKEGRTYSNSFRKEFACPYATLSCPTQCNGAPCGTSVILLAHRDGIRSV